MYVPFGRRRRRREPMFISFMLTWLILGYICLVVVVAIDENPSNTIVTTPSTTPTTGGGSCNPSNCVAKCSPSCSSDQVCVLGTMSNCGVCPASQCVSRSVLGGGNSSPSASNTPTSSSGQENDSDSGNSNNNGSLIGGLVGGLLGAGLVLSAAGYAGFRYKQKKNTLPFAFHGKSTMSQQQPPSHSPTPPSSKTRSLTLPSQVSSSSPPMENISTSTNIPSMSMNNNSYSGEYDESSRQQVMSGVIPIAYIPPSRQSTSPNQLQQQNINHRSADTIQEQQQQYDNAVAQSYSVYSNKRTSHLTKQNSLQRHQSVLSTATDPFSDDHHSRNSMLTTDDEDDGRASISSSVVGHATTMSAMKATQAYQMQRAKPQIMRVNTVRVNNGLARSGSTRTVLTRDSAQLSRSNTAPTQRQEHHYNDKELQKEQGKEQHQAIQLTDETITRPSSAPTEVAHNNNNNNGEEDDPFHDRHSTTHLSSSNSSDKLRPQLTDSMVSTGPSDGEITIFWDANRSTPSLSPASFPMPPPSP